MSIVKDVGRRWSSSQKVRRRCVSGLCLRKGETTRALTATWQELSKFRGLGMPIEASLQMRVDAFYCQSTLHLSIEPHNGNPPRAIGIVPRRLPTSSPSAASLSIHLATNYSNTTTPTTTECLHPAPNCSYSNTKSHQRPMGRITECCAEEKDLAHEEAAPANGLREASERCDRIEQVQ